MLVPALGTPVVSVEVHFPIPAVAAISTNQATGSAWQANRRKLAGWRAGVGWGWNLLPKAARAEVVGRRCEVAVTIPFATNRRRDPANYVGTVVKAIVDQLVEQGVWPDDSPEWVTVAEPTLVVGDTATVRLTPLEEPA